MPIADEVATVLDPGIAERCPRCGSPIAGSWLTCAACDAPLASAAQLPAGTLLHDGRYRLERVLGRGGFGITYEAYDRRLQRRIAIKELFPESVVRHGVTVVAPPGDRSAFAEARGRFLREARTLARFSHPGIVRIYEAFEEHRTVYLVMELLEGRTLASLALERAEPFRGEEVLDVVARVGAALQQVHAAGVLHRDVGPSNVILTDGGRLVLIDFGIARAFERTTGPVTQVMTPGYAPPEQYRSDAELTPASDVYALAATAYRLATGQIPPGAPERLAGAELASPWRVNPSVPKTVSDALLDGLELDAAHRPGDIRAFLARAGAADEILPARSMLHGSVPRPAEPPRPEPPRAESPPVPPPPPPAGLRPAPAVAPPRLVVPAPEAVRGADRLAPGPRAVGPHRRGRRKVLAPVLVATVAFASATPVIAAALVVLAALPALATVGDDVVHRHRQAAGQAWRRWHRWPPGLVLPLRAVRNVGVSVLRSVPALAFGAVVVGSAALLDHTDVSSLLRSTVVRVGGALLGFGLVWPATSAGVNFRSGLGVDRGVDEFLDPDGRYAVAGWALLLICGAITAASLWLTPEIWPL